MRQRTSWGVLAYTMSAYQDTLRERRARLEDRAYDEDARRTQTQNDQRVQEVFNEET